jgi:hypothetical protein
VPQFEWLDANKSWARFSRQILAEIKTELNLFDGVVKAERSWTSSKMVAALSTRDSSTTGGFRPDQHQEFRRPLSQDGT